MARGKKVWWWFLRIKEDGWSSGFRSVHLLLRHLARKTRSISSRNNYCYTLWRICSKFKLKPDELVSLAHKDNALVAERIQDFADSYDSKASTRYANHIIYVARAFFKANKVKVELEGYSQPTRSRKRPEYIPTLGEALKMGSVARGLRDKLLILFLIYTGLRNSTLRAIRFNETYPDLWLQNYTIKRELEKGEKCVVIIVHEIMKDLIPTACKNKIFYYTFIPPKVTELLRLYIHERKEKYGPILDDEPLFITKNRRIPLSERRKTPISARELQEIVKNAARRAGLKHWRHVYPHCLRKTYESFLRGQPDGAKLDVKEREYLFGHILPGSQDAYFDKTKIEEMRAKYARMAFEPAPELKTEQRVVSEDELQSFLEQGWQLVTVLPSKKVVVSRKIRTKETRENSNVKKNHKILTKEENVHIDTRTPVREPSSLNSYLNSSAQKTRHLRNETLKERRGQLSIQNWGKPQACESLSNLKPVAKTNVEEKEHVAESTSRNKVAETRQRRLSDFVA